MDPNAALDQIRVLCTEIDNEDDEAWFTMAELASELIDVVRGLDSWLTAGGFLPTAWREG